jgi:hypothetical protein
VNPLRWLVRLLFEDDNEPPGPEELVLLARAEGEAVAGMWREMLRNQGIESMIKNTNPVAVYVGEYFGRCEIHVLHRDLERARAVLGIEPAE